MSGTLSPQKWANFVSESYLDDFIAAGGSAVKFAVCYDVTIESCIELVAEAAVRRGFLVADIDARNTQIHQIERVFGSIAEQLPWRELVDQVLIGLAAAQGWHVPERFPAGESIAQQLGELNALGSDMVNLELRRSIRDGIMGDKRLAKDFRVAMTWLALARLGGGPREANDFERIGDWLAARVSRISVMKDYAIFNKITRANARYMLGSLLVWIRMSNRPGLVVNIDASRILESGSRHDGAINYSKAAILDAYEVFRQFIDATDEMESLLINIFVPPSFLDLETTGRGIGRYPALMYRVYDEIRDRQLANPLSALVRISRTKKAV
jgi:hypothetical protein